MANKKYADLVNEVLPYLAADPSDPVTEQAIRRTVIQFCADSWIWKAFQDPVSVRAGLNQYDLEPETGADVSAVVAVELDGRTIHPKTPVWLNKEIPRWKTVTGTPKYFTQMDTESLFLAPLPQDNQANALTITLALQPTQKSDGFPMWIYNQYADALVNGAVGRLMLMNGKPWADPANGLDRRNSFMSEIASARNDAVSALGIAPTRVTPQH